jgi:hypothetical protein
MQEKLQEKRLEASRQHRFNRSKCEIRLILLEFLALGVAKLRLREMADACAHVASKKYQRNGVQPKNAKNVTTVLFRAGKSSFSQREAIA